MLSIFRIRLMRNFLPPANFIFEFQISNFSAASNLFSLDRFSNQSLTTLSKPLVMDQLPRQRGRCLQQCLPPPLAHWQCRNCNTANCKNGREKVFIKLRRLVIAQFTQNFISYFFEANGAQCQIYENGVQCQICEKFCPMSNL